MGRHFTLIGGATAGGSEWASVTAIYGGVFIDSRIQENIINKDENCYRGYSFLIFLKTCKESKIEKTKY